MSERHRPSSHDASDEGVRGRHAIAAGRSTQSAGASRWSPPALSPRPRRRAPYDGGMVDERDLDIIATLQMDARATYADVAARVGMSASAVHERVRKLEQAGVIRSYRAVVDPEALGLFVTALIAATPLDPQQPDDLPDRVAEFPEVEDCLSVAGEASYILKVRTKTTGDLEDLIRRLREKAGVATRTTIALSIPFEGRPLPT